MSRMTENKRAKGSTRKRNDVIYRSPRSLGTQNRYDRAPDFKQGKVMGAKVDLGFSKVLALRYIDPTDNRYSAVTDYYAWSIRINNVYDPDPSLGSGGITGFNEISAFYTWNIVQKMQMNITVSNWETFPIHVGAIYTPSAVTGTITSRALALDALERQGSIFSTEISAKGGNDRCSFSSKVKPGVVLGNEQQYLGSGNFVGGYNTNPMISLYVTFIIVAPSGNNLANGVVYNAEFVYKVKFYNLRSTLLSAEQRSEIVHLMYQRQTHHKRGETDLIEIIDHSIEEILQGKRTCVPLCHEGNNKNKLQTVNKGDVWYGDDAVKTGDEPASRMSGKVERILKDNRSRINALDSKTQSNKIKRAKSLTEQIKNLNFELEVLEEEGI